MRCLAALLGIFALAVADKKKDEVPALDDGSVPPLLQLRENGFNEFVMPSDAVWAVVALENDERCGEQCGIVRRELSKANMAAGGAMQFAWMLATDVIVTPTGETVAIYTQFNITSTPTVLVFAAGRKNKVNFQYPAVFPPQAAVQLLAAGAKAIYENIKAFVPSLATSVRRRIIPDFLTKGSAPTLPRVVLFSDAPTPSITLKQLTIDFTSRAVFGVAKASDKDMAVAFGADDKRRLFVSGLGPHSSVATEIGESGVVSPSGPLSTWSCFDGPNMSYPVLRAWLDKTLPPAPIPQLASQADFDKHCGPGNSGVCFIAVLPESVAREEAEGETDPEGPLATLRAVASSNFLQPDYSTLQSGNFVAERLSVTFAWVTQGQEDFVDGFEVTAVPSMVALNPRKKLYTLLKLSFSRTNIEDLVFAMMNYKPQTHGKTPMEQSEAARLVDLQTIKVLPKLKTEVPAHVQAAAKAKAAAAAGKGAGKGTGKKVKGAGKAKAKDNSEL